MIEEVTVTDRLMAVCDKLEELYHEANTIKSEMSQLEDQGMVCAKAHWPKDKPGAMELLYSTQSEYYKKNGRRRQYIGKDKQKIAEAKAAITRWHEHRDLRGQLSDVKSKIYDIENGIKRLERIAQVS